MKFHDYMYFIPGFMIDGQAHCPDNSKSLPYLLCLKRGGFTKKLMHVNDRSPIQGSYLTMPCNYIFVILKLFFISNIKLFMPQAQQNMDLLLETI